MEIDSVSTSGSLSICNIYNHDQSFRQKIGLFNPKKKGR
jgi:hypothetical protein